MLLVHCLYQMLALNHKRTTSSLAPPIFYAAKKFCNKKIEGSPLEKSWAKHFFYKKNLLKNVGEIGPCSQFHQHFMSSFYTHRSQKRKKDSQVVSLFLCFWDLHAPKSCSFNVDEIDPYPSASTKHSIERFEREIRKFYLLQLMVYILVMSFQQLKNH